ncbi:ParB/RepB/Spo0J family partition protein [Sphingobium limneticum]|uniref:ParB/RepB/Spo0J family partition protein n=1 Tax=Sphingobium limneticum TaxID=1007511 RepID=UPI003D00B986
MPRAKKAAPVAPESEVAMPSVALVAPSAITSIAYSRLRRAPENVRQTDIAADVESLADDIAAHGLLQSLIGYLWNVRVPDASVVHIVGGGRRLQALQRLWDLGAIDDDFAVPVLIRPKDEAIELSLSENLARRDMNPADEFTAFAALMRPGTLSIADLAKRFGFSERYVQQRMRLAGLIDEILDGLRAGEMTLDAAMAYAKTQDPALQLKIYKAQCKAPYTKHDAGAIGREIINAQMRSDNGLFKFVGVEAYEAEGGGYEDDLFGDALGYAGARKIRDPQIVMDLAKPKAETAAQALLRDAKVQHGCTIDLLLVPGLAGNKMPKAPRGAKLVNRGWNYSLPTYAELRQKADDLGIAITAIASIRSDGVLKIDEQFFVPADRMDDVIPPKGEAAPAKTPEQYAAERRVSTIRSIAAHLAARSVREEKLDGRQFWATSQPSLYRKEDIAGVGPCYPVTVNVFVTDAEIDAQLTAAEDALVKQEILDATKKEQEEKARAEREGRREALLALDPAPAVVLVDEAPYFRWESGAWSDVRESGADDEDAQFYDDLAELLEGVDIIGPHWPTIAAYDAEEPVEQAA